jgi:hypothetical protein
MKNYVGINGAKDWLPHHRKGSVREGGDEYPAPCFRKRLVSASWDIRWRLRSRLLQRVMLLGERVLYATQRLRPFPDQFWEGSWWGNATISRTTVDLNRLCLYADRSGTVRDVTQRRLFYIVDGILCGEGEGPMGATPKQCGFLLGGSNAWAVDMTVATLMGFAHTKVDTLRAAAEPHRLPVMSGEPRDIMVKIAGQHRLGLAELRDAIGFRFVPPHSWVGQIELPEGA